MKAYNFSIRNDFFFGYDISWSFLNHGQERTVVRWTTEKGARRFCRAHGLLIPRYEE